MNIAEAQKKLILARKRAKKLREDIAQLRQTIIDAGGDPNPGKTDILNRNKQIYREIKSGRKAGIIANHHGIIF